MFSRLIRSSGKMCLEAPGWSLLSRPFPRQNKNIWSGQGFHFPGKESHNLVSQIRGHTPSGGPHMSSVFSSKKNRIEKWNGNPVLLLIPSQLRGIMNKRKKSWLRRSHRISAHTWLIFFASSWEQRRSWVSALFRSLFMLRPRIEKSGTKLWSLERSRVVQLVPKKELMGYHMCYKIYLFRGFVTTITIDVDHRRTTNFKDPKSLDGRQL